MKGKYLCIVVGIVLAALLFVGAGAAAGDAASGMKVGKLDSDYKADDLFHDEPIADNKNTEEDYYKEFLKIAIEQFNNHPVPFLVMAYVENQMDGTEKIYKRVRDFLADK